MISHSDGLTVELSSKTKDLIESDWYKEFFPDVQIRMDTQAKSNFKNTFGGARVSTSMGASITGFGANFIVIDDALMPTTLATSTLRIRTGSTEKRFTTVSTTHRLTYASSSGNVFTRTICLDTSRPMTLGTSTRTSFYLSSWPWRWTLELADQYRGRLLWPTRFPIDSFPGLTTSDYVFATQYLQRPAPLAGGLIKKDWFVVVSSVPNDIPCHLFIDTAQTKDIKKDDPSTTLIAGIKDNTVYIRVLWGLVGISRSIMKDHWNR